MRIYPEEDGEEQTAEHARHEHEAKPAESFVADPGAGQIVAVHIPAVEVALEFGEGLVQLEHVLAQGVHEDALIPVEGGDHLRGPLERRHSGGHFGARGVHLGRPRAGAHAAVHVVVQDALVLGPDERPQVHVGLHAVVADRLDNNAKRLGTLEP